MELEPMDKNVPKNIEQLIQKAAQAEKSEDAMRFSQAATNSANAMMCLLSDQALSNSMREAARDNALASDEGMR
jgi:uncharacterized protein involved in propanediol utilization